MKLLKIGLLLGMSIGSLATVAAQEVLTLEKAIATALANNHQINIQKYQVEAQALQVNPALVGRKPVMNLNAAYELGWSDASIETLSLNPEAPPSEPLELDGWSNDFSVAPEISLLLLDGKASKYRLDQLQAATDIAQLQLQQTIEQTVAEVSLTYLQLAQLQEQITITEQSIALGQERLERARQDATYGTSGSLQELQITVDLKTDSAGLRNQILVYENTRRGFNQLLGQAPAQQFIVSTSFTLQEKLDLKTLEKELRNNNLSLRLSQQNVRLADLEIQLAQSAKKPQLQAYANVSYGYFQNEASFLTVNRAVGPNAGLRFNYPIIDGGARRIKEQVTVINKTQTLVQQESTEEQLIVALHNAFANYQNNQEQLRIERSNLELFQRNLDNQQNRYLLGTATNTDVRTAQLNLDAARNRISNYRYRIKEAEINLFLLSGQLVQ